MTAEDPVEYNLKGVNQVQVNEGVGRTFAAILRSFLRQDPDVILVGETRDLETAQIAIRAALTGHLVFSTLHTNDCPSTVARLVDMGIPPFLGRLLPRADPGPAPGRQSARTARSPTRRRGEPGPLWPPPRASARRPSTRAGVRHLQPTGMKGRVALYEVMPIDRRSCATWSSKAHRRRSCGTAPAAGVKTLRQAGLSKCWTASHHRGDPPRDPRLVALAVPSPRSVVCEQQSVVPDPGSRHRPTLCFAAVRP